MRIYYHETAGQAAAILDGMVHEGLVMMEKVRVLKYAPGLRPPRC